MIYTFLAIYIIIQVNYLFKQKFSYNKIFKKNNFDIKLYIESYIFKE